MEPMAPIALLVISLLIGMGMQKIKAFPENTYVALNQYLIHVALPALALIHVPHIVLQTDLLFPVATSWVVLLFAMLFARFFSMWMQWSRETTGCIILTAGLGNTAFVGFPVVEALYGSEGLQVALIVDQPGTFMVVTTMGIFIASIYSSAHIRKRVVLREVILFPPFIVFVIALVMNLLDIQVEGVMLGVLEQLAATLTPIALISVGLQLKFSLVGENIKPLISGLVYKLVLAPATLLLIYKGLLGGEGMVIDVSVIQSAMPPMITGSILAATYGLNPRLASLMVGIGIPLSAATITLWYLLLMWFG